jgi:hypothetical protein
MVLVKIHLFKQQKYAIYRVCEFDNKRTGQIFTISIDAIALVIPLAKQNQV